MPKKRKSKKRSKSKKKPGILTIIILMVVGLFLCGFTYRLFFGPDKVGEDQGNLAELQNVVSHQDMLQSDDPAKLLDYLKGKEVKLMERQQDISIEESTLIQNERFEAAERLIEIAESRQQQTVGIKHHLAAARGLVALQYADKNSLDLKTIDELGLNAQLRRLAEKYAEHPDKSIQQQADSGLLLIDVYGYTASLYDRNSSQEVRTKLLAKAKETFVSILQRYSDDRTLLRPIRMAFTNWAQASTESAGELVKQLYNDLYGKGDENLDIYIQNLSDLHLLKTLDFRAKIDKRITESKSDQPLLQAALAILRNERFGNRALLDVTATSDWYESRNDLAATEKIYRAMQAAASTNKGLAPKQRMKDFAEKGLQRIGMEGKRVDIDANSLSGVRLSNKSLNNQIIVLVFWSGRNDSSLKLLQQMYKQKDEIRQKHVEVVPVSMRSLSDFDSEAKSFVKKSPDWNFLQNENAGFEDQFSVTTVPHLMVLNHEHTVVRVRSSLEDLDDVVDLAIKNRFAALNQRTDQQESEGDKAGSK